MLVEAQSAVRLFNDRFEFPTRHSPELMRRDRVTLRAKWMTEEVNEFVNAATIEDQADALADLIYFTLGAFVEMGVQAGPVFQIVHEANMEKVGSSGEIKRDAEGKIIKPDDWSPPTSRIRLALKSQ